MFTLAHLSDPHLAPLPKPRFVELIGKRVTGYINWQRRRRFIHDAETLARLVADLKAQGADHIAVTGDLTNIALPEEFEHGRDWLQGLGAPADVTVIPGNHDAYVRAARDEPKRCWSEFMRGDPPSTHSRESGNPEPNSQSQQPAALGPRLRGDERFFQGFPFVRRRGPVALIGLSTAVPTLPFMATGRLGHAQLARLDETLAALGGEPVFRVVLIHHPPVSETRAHKRLTDAEAFKRAIGARGAELVLHGHDHLHMLNWLDGPQGSRVPAIGVPSASGAWATSKNPAAYNLYVIDGAPGAWRCEMISRGITPKGSVEQQRRRKIFG
jgi:3',5'-cyclic AMP phosphodiesterase CpdA